MATSKQARQADGARGPVAQQLGLLGLDAEVGNDEVPGPAQSPWASRQLPCTGQLELRCPRCGLGMSLDFRCVGSCERGCARVDQATSTLLRSLPRVPVRHWVLKLPAALASHAAREPKLLRELGRCFIEAVFEFVGQWCLGAEGRRPVACGATSLVHRTGQLLGPDLHLHALVLDGGYVHDAGGTPTFIPMQVEPSGRQLQRLVRQIRVRVLRRWRALGWRRGSGRALAGAQVQQGCATGPGATPAVRRVKVHPRPPPQTRPAGVGAWHQHWGVHAMDRVAAEERQALQRLAAYLMRAPVSLALTQGSSASTVVHRLARPFADGTTHVEFSRAELVQRLVALAAPGHRHRVSYHGVLAPKAAEVWGLRPSQLQLLDPGPRQPKPRRGSPTGQGPPVCTRCGADLEVVGLEQLTDGELMAPTRRSA